MSVSKSLIRRLERICGSESVLSDPDELLVYESDAYPLVRGLPGGVVFPTSTEATSQVLKALHDHEVAFVPRGSGTSLAGGCLTGSDAVMVCTSKMKRILEVDLDNECAIVEAGVITQEISDAVAEYGYFYAPDPASQSTCTIGGNVATDAGGPHTLKYGVTGHHVFGLTVVLPCGEVLPLGGRTQTTHGYDLGSVFIGSEGTLGLVTEVTVKLTRPPAAYRTVLAVYDRMDDAGNTVRDIIAAGIVPAALEIMDQAIVHILEDAYAYGFPRDAEAVLIIELDGIEAGRFAELPFDVVGLPGLEDVARQHQAVQRRALCDLVAGQTREHAVAVHHRQLDARIELRVAQLAEIYSTTRGWICLCIFAIARHRVNTRVHRKVLELAFIRNAVHSLRVTGSIAFCKR